MRKPRHYTFLCFLYQINIYSWPLCSFVANFDSATSCKFPEHSDLFNQLPELPALILDIGDIYMSAQLGISSQEARQVPFLSQSLPHLADPSLQYHASELPYLAPSSPKEHNSKAVNEAAQSSRAAHVYSLDVSVSLKDVCLHSSDVVLVSLDRMSLATDSGAALLPIPFDFDRPWMHACCSSSSVKLGVSQLTVVWFQSAQLDFSSGLRLQAAYPHCRALENISTNFGKIVVGWLAWFLRRYIVSHFNAW